MRTTENVELGERVAVTNPAELLRVLLVHERFPPDFGGGGERTVLAIALHLIQAGVAVQVLTTGDPRVTSYEGIPTIRLPVSRYALNLALPSILRLARQADVIQTFNYHACLPSLLAGKLTRKPVVCLFLGLIQQAWIDMRGPVVGRAYMYWEKLLATRGFSRLLFLTEDNREAAIRLGARAAHTSVNRLGITPGEFVSALEKENIVLFVGKFDVRKGVYDVLEVARALPHVPFVMIGWGSLESELRTLAPQNVRFYSIEDRSGLRNWMGRASTFLLPSRGEGFPLALLEAMASGCAAVATVSVDFEGAHVAPGDREAMIASIKKLWAHPDEARRLGEINAELAKQFSWENHISRLIAVYREVIDEGRRAVSR